jgi:hypothetical protein
LPAGRLDRPTLTDLLTGGTSPESLMSLLGADLTHEYVSENSTPCATRERAPNDANVLDRAARPITGSARFRDQ